MYLCISSSTRTHFDVMLLDSASKIENIQKEAPNLLTAVDNFLQEQKFLKEDIEGIFVVVGVGTFSGVRSGTVLANAWSLLKKIPVMSISAEQAKHVQDCIPQLNQTQGYTLPTYTAEPNIRMKKSDQ